MRVLILITLLMVPSFAFAEDDPACAQACAEGQQQVTFADGNNARCSCADQSNGMIPNDELEPGCPVGEDCSDSYVQE